MKITEMLVCHRNYAGGISDSQQLQILNKPFLIIYSELNKNNHY